ncbi:uncharacterized protein RCO7_14065 [Rhynchosporium graminicola]|uniref:Uncharacterized protein n=1 Tax=Rhynchosporium graminicola TaxID=2792576 RepID=A0A1E1LPQ8_9HELO|nr:uncharacterized protein RCO7_14065 [Rhynchosporium commune]
MSLSTSLTGTPRTALSGRIPWTRLATTRWHSHWYDSAQPSDLRFYSHARQARSDFIHPRCARLRPVDQVPVFPRSLLDDLAAGQPSDSPLSNSYLSPPNGALAGQKDLAMDKAQNNMDTSHVVPRHSNHFITRRMIDPLLRKYGRYVDYNGVLHEDSVVTCWKPFKLFLGVSEAANGSQGSGICSPRPLSQCSFGGDDWLKSPLVDWLQGTIQKQDSINSDIRISRIDLKVSAMHTSPGSW